MKTAGPKIHCGIPGEHRNRSRAQRLAQRLVDFRFHILGKENAMVSGRLMASLGYPPRGTNQPLREAAKILLEEGVPVISCPQGFFLALTREELAEYKRSLENRMEGLARDMEAVTRIMMMENIHGKAPVEKVQQKLF